MKAHAYRIGIGYDIHRLVPNRKLVLGGVEIPSELGLDGHSDADCLTHAIADAILGACALPDIGNQFPNTDPDITGINSQIILKKAQEIASKSGFQVGNLDASIIAEKPKISPYINEMKSVLADTLRISTDQIGIKATTQEKIGALGAAEGIAAHAVCTVYRE
ncbi:MAG: 2-C-methyl-D-erythritol 2,4-cyclodiphosphate synthase [Opitutaceae bacterium]|nr:2-C-methyl-D-erythritol 2,4-cyclodiphosphate synthase [Opitutaceae bacterium]